MELDNLGIQCSFVECKQLDFLPVECIHCHQLFCKHHYVDYQHNCANSSQKNKTVLVEQDSKSKSYHCSIVSCKGRELTPIVCEKCQERFCLKHRLPTDHSCCSLPVKKIKEDLTPKEKVAKITGKELSVEKPVGKVGKKSTKMSLKVIEMKLKMKAKGENSIPLEERIYFYIHLTCGDPISMYFSKEYSVGKIIDLIATYENLKNLNHLTDSKKLRLLDSDDIQIPVDLKLSNVIDSSKYNVMKFGDIYIKYV